MIQLAVTGDEQDISNWRKLFAPPGRPLVEVVDREERSFIILCDDTLQGFDNPNQLYEAARPIVRALNSIVTAQAGYSNVRIEGVLETAGSGAWKLHAYMTATAELLRMRVGIVTVDALDKDGKPLLRQPSVAQRLYEVATGNELIQEALHYFHAEADWVDLFKAFEALKAAGLVKKSAEWGLFTHTANTIHRHAKSKDHAPPKKPMTISEARELIGQTIRSAVG